MKLYGEITKVDEQDDGTIIVTGIASSGSVDDAGETVTPEAMKAALPDYMAFGAIREMHGLSAAGTTLKAGVDDGGVTTITTHVVDPVAVLKVKTKVYKGFSIGGKVLKRDPTDRTIITSLKLNEISLVDRPCNPDAVIGMWKADGAHLEDDTMTDTTLNGAVPAAITNEAVKAEAERMAKTAGVPSNWRNYLTKARATLMAAETPVDATTDIVADPVIEPAIEVTVEKTVVEPVVAAESIVDPVDALNAALDAATKAAAPAAPTSLVKTIGLEETGLGLVALVKAVGEQPLAKGLYTVSRLASIISDLSYIQADTCWETQAEGDNSTMPQALATSIQGLGANLIAMAQEEVAELIASLGEHGIEIDLINEDFAYAAKIVDLVKANTELMEKAGARHSKADMAKIQAMHDQSAALGAKCSADNTDKAAGVDDLAKAQTEVERLTKALTDAAPRVEALGKAVNDQGEALTKALDTIADLTKRLETVENTPAAPKTQASVLHAVTKGADITPGATPPSAASPDAAADMVKAYIDSLPEAERQLLITKAALAQPIYGATRRGA